MAVEGSLVLPIFLFFMITILLSIEAVRFQSDAQEAMHQSGNQYAFTSYLEKYANQPSADIESQVKGYLDDQLYPYLCVSGGRNGVKIQNLSTIAKTGVLHL